MIFMATTKISADKTAGEISSLLSRSGRVKYIQSEYDNGEIIGISFIVISGAQEIPFRLPAKWEPVLEAMKKDRRTPRHLLTPEQARRTAWRQVLRWVQAQMAFIEVGMVDIKEAFMAYLMVSTKQTLYEKLRGLNFNMIEYKKDDQIQAK
jgi:hypothetical protein